MLDYVRKLQDNIYLAEIPLKGNPLKSINIYIIKTDEGNIIVDTGFNTEEIRSMTKEFIKDMELEPSKTKLFLTHFHADHTGLANFYDDLGVEIIFSEVDAIMNEDFMDRYGVHWVRAEKLAHMQGMGVDQIELEDHPGYRYKPSKAFKVTMVNPGDKLKLGDFNFEFIDLSGHTPGMLGMYDKDKKIFFCGDHILGKITPNIQFWGFDIGDSLGTYLKNLEKIKHMDVEHLYSSHRFLVDDVDKRIETLKAHHSKRLNETLSILEKYGKCTVRDITKNLQWDINARNWDEFPKAQKWFAAGEAHAHLEYLRHREIIDFSKDDNGILHYFLVNPDNVEKIAL